MSGFLLASFGFVEFFYILLERSQEIHQHMVFLLSPIIRSMTVVTGFFLLLSLPPTTPREGSLVPPVLLRLHDRVHVGDIIYCLTVESSSTMQTLMLLSIRLGGGSRQRVIDLG